MLLFPFTCFAMHFPGRSLSYGKTDSLYGLTVYGQFLQEISTGSFLTCLHWNFSLAEIVSSLYATFSLPQRFPFWVHNCKPQLDIYGLLREVPSARGITVGIGWFILEVLHILASIWTNGLMLKLMSGSSGTIPRRFC